MSFKKTEIGLIPEDWRVKEINDIGEVVGGSTPSTKVDDYWNGDISWITPKDLSNHPYIHIEKGERNITEKGLNNCSTKLLPKGTVLFSSRAPIGYVAIAKNHLCTNQGFKSIICNDEVDNIFFYYLLKEKTDLIKHRASGSTFSEISGSRLKRVKLPIPKLEEQKEIANVLFKIDKKIELNKKINKTLEEISQAIYKSWFIDFEPWKDKEFIDSELGKIPKGWEIKKLKDIFTIQNGYAFKSKDYQESGFKVIRTVNIKENNFLNNEKVVFLPDEFKEEKYDKYRFKKFDVVMVMVGASVGKIGIIMDHNLPALQNQNMWRFRAKLEKINQPFVFSTIKSLQEKAKKWATGSARNYLRKGDFGEIKCIVPPEDILSDYNEKVIDIFNKINNNLKENQTLKQLRDTLLPKLMSGEIRAPLDD